MRFSETIEVVKSSSRDGILDPQPNSYRIIKVNNSGFLKEKKEKKLKQYTFKLTRWINVTISQNCLFFWYKVYKHTT